MKTKDQQLSEPMECEDCGKVCQGIQGIRGHRRGCPGRKPVALNQGTEPGTPLVEPAKPLVHASNQQITLGSRLEIEGCQVVIRIHEPVRALRERLCESLPIREVMDGFARSKKWPTYEDWYSLARDVARIELATERMLQQARVSRDEPWTLHQLAITVRNRWVSWRREEAYRTWEKQSPQRSDGESELPEHDLDEFLTDFGIPELEAHWNHVIEGLRWLTAHTKATL